jgi:V/A-type H+-transporting ATPase subunit E
MNGINKITDRIAAEAQSEIDAVLSQGKAQADKLRAEFEKKARETYDELLRTGTDEVEQDVQRQGRNARLEARKAVLSLKQEMIAAAFERAGEKLLALPEEEYVAFLARQAGAAALTGREEIVLNENDRARIGEKVTAAANALAAERGLPGEMKLSGKTRPMAGGVVLRQGDIEVNCALESLLELSRGALDADVARILFQ